jgi:hypothetical protein
MRRVLFAILLLGLSCKEEESSLPPICEDCENADGCPDRQPTINPLVACSMEGATCHYCGEGIASWTCRDMQGDGNLVWAYDGQVDECPPPVMDTDG